MPTIAPGEKVLVTGANGFLAVHIVDRLLKKGYAVRGVVRSLDKGEHLKKLFTQDKFEIAVVQDITTVWNAFLHLICSLGYSSIGRDSLGGLKTFWTGSMLSFTPLPHSIWSQMIPMVTYTHSLPVASHSLMYQI